MASTAHLNAPCTQQLCRKKQKTRQISYETVMTEAVDKSLSTLGHSSKQAIYFHLENAFKIEKQEIPCKIAEFAEAIEQLFGAGAKLIEMRIIEALHEKIQDFVYTPKKGNFSFTEYVASLHLFLKLQAL